MCFAGPDNLGNELDKLNYAEWHFSGEHAKYKLDHEPLFAVVDHVNRYDGEKLDMLVSVKDQPEFLETGSFDYLKSITSFAFDNPGSKLPKLATNPRSADGKSTGVTPTDTAWKGVWQGIMSRYEHTATLPSASDVRNKIKMFRSHIIGKKLNPPAKLCFAPFRKVMAIDGFVVTQLDDETKEWVEEICTRLPRAPPAPRRLTAESTSRKRANPGSGPTARSKSPRGRDVALASELGESDDEEYDITDVREIVDGFMSPQDGQRLNSKINTAAAVLDGRMDKMDTRIQKLEDNTGSTKGNQQQAGVDLAVQAAQAKAHATMGDKLSAAQKHMEQTQTLIGTLGTAMQLTRVILTSQASIDRFSSAPGQADGASVTLADQLTAPQYSQIINLVNDVWCWKPSQKRAFYGAFKSIPVFNDEYDKVVGMDDGVSS